VKQGLLALVCAALPGISGETRFDRILSKLCSLGYTIDETHTKRQAGGNVIIYLPDTHNDYNQAYQRARIFDIDDNVSLNAIGLEGLVGEITPEMCAERVKRARFEKEKFESDILGADYKDAPSYVKMLRHLVNLNRVVSEYDEKSLPKISDISFAYFKKEISKVVKATDFCDEDQLSDKDILEKRIGAPGLPYGLLVTRASKIGMEDAKEDSEAMAVMTYQFADLAERNYRSQLDYLRGLAKNTYEPLEGDVKTQFANTVMKPWMNFDKTGRQYLAELKQLKEEAKNRMSAEARALIDAGGSIDLAHDKDILSDRSYAWVENTKDKGVVLMIGGSRHVESVYDACKEKGCSIITIKQDK